MYVHDTYAYHRAGSLSTENGGLSRPGTSPSPSPAAPGYTPRMKALLVQPPFVQLNAPYPALHYLEAYLRGRGHEAVSYDHSIELYRRIFSRPGLERVFRDARSLAPAGKGGRDEAARSQLERYFSYEGLYLEWIEGLVGFLAGSDPAFAHRLAAAAELPRGQRAAELLEAEAGRIGVERAGELATRILEDLGDLVSYALDPDFGTVRYADRLASSRASFEEIRAGLGSSYLLREFYAPLLGEFWAERARELGPAGRGAAAEGESVLVLLSLPFPGCLAGALECAAAARRELGPRAVIVAGGGYVSTELRGLRDGGIFDYVDFLSFDAGYGSLESILEALPALRSGGAAGGLYRTMRRGLDGGVLAEGFGDGDGARYAALERAALESTAPDYRSADFPRYLRFADSRNAMHRLWSDSPWLKYQLARGCYWARCEFCDTELEYVRGYVPAKVESVAAAAAAAAERSGLYGIHFVDEALPMASLLLFARENRRRAARGERPFHYWGNVRFDPSWTADRAEFLAASGLVAVSGGIEIATEAGLAMTGKGFGLAQLVACLVGMRRAGLLVHAYLIYGFPGQGGQDIVDSAEVCRQLFAAGLVDSAFWHRFVLTRHSRMYAEWKAGRRPGLEPVDRPGNFADNDLGFRGSEAYDRFDEPLAASLARWMEGEGLDRPFGAGLGRRFPRASVEPGLVEALIARAEEGLERSLATGGSGRCQWVAGRPEPSGSGLAWAYRGEMARFEGGPDELAALEAAIALAARPEGASGTELEAALGPAAPRLDELRGLGLLRI